MRDGLVKKLAQMVEHASLVILAQAVESCFMFEQVVARSFQLAQIVIRHAWI